MPHQPLTDNAAINYRGHIPDNMPLNMLKNLFTGSSNDREAEVHRDKLAQNKQNEKDVREAAKVKRQEAKARKSEEHAAAAVAHRMDRAHNEVQSKRAAKDAREEKKHQDKQQEGFTCEHGVFKCRICHPVTKHK